MNSLKVEVLNSCTLYSVRFQNAFTRNVFKQSSVGRKQLSRQRGEIRQGSLSPVHFPPCKVHSQDISGPAKERTCAEFLARQVNFPVDENTENFTSRPDRILYMPIHHRKFPE